MERRQIARAVENARKRSAASGDRIGNSRVGSPGSGGEMAISTERLWVLTREAVALLNSDRDQ
jgi:hypothetical protein